jgi:hypothetical protein
VPTVVHKNAFPLQVAVHWPSPLGLVITFEITFSSGWQPVCPALTNFSLLWIAGDSTDGNAQLTVVKPIITRATRGKMPRFMMKVPRQFQLSIFNNAIDGFEVLSGPKSHLPSPVAF